MQLSHLTCVAQVHDLVIVCSSSYYEVLSFCNDWSPRSINSCSFLDASIFYLSEYTLNHALPDTKHLCLSTQDCPASVSNIVGLKWGMLVCQAMRQNISHLSTIVRTPIRLMTSCFTTKGRTVKQQAAAMAAQRSVHTHKLRHQKRVTRRAHLRYSKASQKLRKALKAIQQLQESQRQLIQLSKQSAGTQQENQRLMRTLKTTAQNCQHARAKLADLQQSVGDHSALRIKNDQLMQQVSDLTASLKAAQEQITQSDICMGLAKSDIRALVSFNQDLQQSVQHYSSLNKQLQQQVNVSEARNSKLDAANQRLKVTLGSFCSRNFSLQRALTKKVSEADAAATDAKTENSRLQRDLTASQQETADVRQQLADAKALAGIAQAWSATLEAQLMASDGKVVDLTQQLSEDDPVKVSLHDQYAALRLPKLPCLSLSLQYSVLSMLHSVMLSRHTEHILYCLSKCGL